MGGNSCYPHLPVPLAAPDRFRPGAPTWPSPPAGTGIPGAAERRGMYRPGVVALCALLVLAGCGGVPGGGDSGGDGEDSTETLTPVAVPGEADTPERLAPGLTEAGVTGPLALANAHGAALEDSHRFDSNWTVRYRNGSLYALANQSTVVAPDGFTTWVTVAGHPGFLTTGPRLTVDLWSNGSVLAERIEREDAVGYRYLDAATYNAGTGFYTSLRRPKPWRDHYALFTAMGTRLVDTRTDTAGPDRYTVVGTRLRDPATFGAATGVREPANVSLRAVIDERGVVRSLWLSYTGRLPTGERVRVSRHVRYTEIGTVRGVSRPAWFETALNGSDDSRGSIPNPRLAG